MKKTQDDRIRTSEIGKEAVLCGQAVLSEQPKVVAERTPNSRQSAEMRR